MTAHGSRSNCATRSAADRGIAHPGTRESRAEYAAPPRLALHVQDAAMASERVLDDGEPQPRAPGLPRAPAVHPVEALGEARDVLRCDADTTVLHLEGRALFRRPPPQCDRAPRGCVADSIADEIAKRTRELA